MRALLRRSVVVLAGLAAACSRSPGEASSQRSSATPAAATATPTYASRPAEVSLRLHFEQGRRWRAITETKLLQQGARRLTRRAATLYEVLDVEPHGTATIRVVDEWLRTEVRQDAGVEARDTRREASLRGASFEWLHRAVTVSQPVVLRVSPRGVVQQVVSSPGETALQQALEKLVARAGAPPLSDSQRLSMRRLATSLQRPEAHWMRWPELPKQRLHVGDGWRQYVEAPSLLGSRVEHRIRYTLERTTARRAHVVYAAKSRWLPSDALARTVDEPQLELTGRFSLDMAHGTLLKSTRTMRGVLTLPDTAVVPGGGELQATLVITTRYQPLPTP